MVLMPGGILGAAAAVLVCATGCGRQAAYMVEGPGMGFVDVTAEAGIRFQYDNDASAHHRYVETTGGGCAFLDFDNDGRLDVFAVQGGPAPGSGKRPRPAHALYRNVDGRRFVDVAEEAGLAVDCGYAQGCAAADYDNDGWTDILVTAYGGIYLFRNDRGRFKEVAKRAGIRETGEPHWSTSA